MPADLFADAGLRPTAKPLTVFRAELIGCEDATWEELFAGFTSLKAITFSSSIEFLVRLADRLDDAEIVFGSESILSKEHLALAQASQTISAYGLADALADHKALTEALGRLLGAAAARCLPASSRDRCGFGCCAADQVTRNCICFPVPPAGGSLPARPI